MNEIGLYGHSGGVAVAIQYALANKTFPWFFADPTLEDFRFKNWTLRFQIKSCLCQLKNGSTVSARYSSTIAKERETSPLQSSHLRYETCRFRDGQNLSPRTFFFGETGRFMNDEDAIGYLDSAVKLFFDSVFFGGKSKELFALSESVPEFSM